MNGFQMDILQVDILCMTDGEAPGRLNAVGRGLGIVGFAPLCGFTGFWYKEGIPAPLLPDVIKRQAPSELYVQVFDPHITDGMIPDTSYQTGVAAVGICNTDIADAYMIDSRGMESLWSPHTIT